MKIVHIKEFLKSDDYKECIEYINGTISETVQLDLRNRHPDKRPIAFKLRPDPNNYMNKYGVPFFDIPLEIGLVKDDRFYVDIDAYTYAMNCQFKSIFLRKFYNPNLNDRFTNFIWDNYVKGQKHSEFDVMELTAKHIFDKCDTVLQFTKEFLYNDAHWYFKRQDIIENFDELIRTGVMKDTHRINDTYMLCKEFLEGQESFSTGINPQIVSGMFYAEYYNKLINCKSKFNYIPSAKYSTREECARYIDGKFMYMHHANGKIFNLQLLMFY